MTCDLWPETCDLHFSPAADTINMCGLFARRGEDFVGLPRVCVSLLALQSNNVTALTQEVQELIGRVESHVFHFQARQEFLEEGLNTELVQRLAMRNNAKWDARKTGAQDNGNAIWSLRSVGFTWRKIAKFQFVSERTLRRGRQEMGWPMGEQEFSEISNQNLDNVVRVKTCKR